MAFISTFIGIDRHKDPSIQELVGAKRDAIALWCLFSDTFPAMQSTLLTDGEATREAVLHAVQETLSNAAPDDVVVLTFSGHGTPTHQLVAYDTDKQNPVGTTIAMSDLSAAFRSSPAKTVLLILDCCFSGAAPAKVMETATLRSTDDSLSLIVEGRGRYLLTASQPDQPALESPVSRHGLLTGAVIDVLQNMDAPIELSAAMGVIMDTVRVQAQQLGYDQTPVLLGYVEGALRMPALRRGVNFAKCFPELVVAAISPNISELADVGFPQPLLEEWSSRFPAGLNALQVRALNELRILVGSSGIVVAPTSSGKTFIGEFAATKAISDGRKAAFLLPYRALVNEKYDEFRALYADKLQFRVIRCTGDYTDQGTQFVRGQYDFALLTYEMFFNLILTNPSVLHQLGLVVLDEAQFLTDPTRGITVELILTYLRAARERGLQPQLVCLSAVIGDVNNLDDWLSAGLLTTTERPVPLIEGVIDRSGTYRSLLPDGTVTTEQLLPAYSVIQRRQKPELQDVIVPLTKTLVANGEKIIIFRNNRGSSEGAAAYLSKELGLVPVDDVLAALPVHDLSSTSNRLRECLAGGTAFHNSNLTREERVLIEHAFRDPESNLRVLVATTTVAAGINTPASTVILAETEFIGQDGQPRPFTVAEYKNMAGRAGRLGFKEQGKVILIAQTPYDAETLFQRYVMGTPEKLKSTFDPKDLDTWIVRLLAQVREIPRVDVIRLLLNTYGGHCASRISPNWKTTIESTLATLLDRMFDLGLLEAEQDNVRLTLLGRACGQSVLSFQSALRLIELVKALSVKDTTPLHLIGIVQALPESDRAYTPMFRRGNLESARSSEASQRFGPEIATLLQRYAPDMISYYARCKRAAMAYDWIHGVPIETIEKNYTVNPFQGRVGAGDIRNTADLTRFLLRSASQITSLLLVESDVSTAVDQLLKRLEVGLPAEALPLLQLPLQLERGEYLALSSNRIHTVDDLASREEENISQILSARRAADFKRLGLLKPTPPAL